MQSNYSPLAAFLLLTSSLHMAKGSTGVGHGAIYVPPDLAAMTCDARDWYLKGDANAKRDLEKFEGISEGLKKEENIENLLRPQLTSLLRQVSEANDNTIALVPKLQGLITRLYGWTRNPGWLDKLKIKTVIWYVDGKRDNKSYYLLNGAALWNKLRVDKYLSSIKTKPAIALREDLNIFEDQILTARDALDDAAQEYVKGIKELVVLTSDIGSNLEKIQKVVGTLREGMNKSSDSILKTSQDAVDSIKARISLQE